MKCELFEECWIGARLLLFAFCGCLSEQEAVVPSEAAFGTTSKPLIFYDGTCTAGQQAKMQRADRIGLVGAKAASWAVGNNRLYKRWFGTYSTSRAADVQDVFDAVVAGWSLDNGDCNAPTLCTSADPPNAWISGTGPIHLCSPALNAPGALRMIGAGSAGTLVHERVHAVSTVIDTSSAVCTDGPDTRCYGYRDDLALADSSPSDAVNNADNYELFTIEAHANRVINPVEAILFL